MQNRDMIYGYARVSTAYQDLTAHHGRLTRAGCERLVCEKITGTYADRLQLRRLLAALQLGDEVITHAVDRISRDSTDLVVIARRIRQSGAGLRPLAGPFLDKTSDFAEVVLAIVGVAAKLESRRILERTAPAAKRRRRWMWRIGRMPKLTRHRQREAVARVAAGEPQRAVARSYNVGQAAIARILLGEATYG